MITTTALTKSYDTTPAVRDVSLHCEPGTITGFLGANGAGKSTTLKMIVGYFFRRYCYQGFCTRLSSCR